MVQKYKEWTETYHSWEEYVRRNPNWDKHPSSRIAGEFARIDLEEKGIHIARYITIPFDPVVHRDVTRFLKKLNEFTKASRNSELQFQVKLESRVA